LPNKQLTLKTFNRTAGCELNINYKCETERDSTGIFKDSLINQPFSHSIQATQT